MPRNSSALRGSDALPEAETAAFSEAMVQVGGACVLPDIRPSGRSAPREATPARPAPERDDPTRRPTPLPGPTRPAITPAGVGTALFFVALLGLAAWGMPYYLLSTSERVRSPLASMFRPSGAVGQSTGIAAFLCFLFLWLYPMRKRFRALAFTGSIAKWLSVHIVAGLGIPLLVGIHGGWHFRGLAGISYIAMLIVVASGFIGKYIYARIPRSRNGLELSLEEIRARGTTVMRSIQATTGLAEDDLRRAFGMAAPLERRPGLLGTLRHMIHDDLQRGQTLKRLRHEWSTPDARGRRLDPAHLEEALQLARDQIATEQQVRLLEATQAIFKFWHAAHRPVAITAFVAVVIHVVVVVALGATWFH